MYSVANHRAYFRKKKEGKPELWQQHPSQSEDGTEAVDLSKFYNERVGYVTYPCSLVKYLSCRVKILKPTGSQNSYREKLL
jgi:hypothetical protein